jgi:hypothetical protein
MLYPISPGHQSLNPRFRQLLLPSNSSIPEKPIPPSLAISQSRHELIPCESDSLGDISADYFKGSMAQKSVASRFDTTQNFHHAATRDHILFRDEILRLLSHDDSGQKLICFDHKTGAKLLIKVVPNGPEMVYWAEKSQLVAESGNIVSVVR